MIPTRERRDYVPYFQERDRGTKEANLSLVLMFVVIVFGLSFLVHMFIEPAHAKETTPKKDYPLTNRGTCERLHEEGMEVRGASMQQVVDLCAQEGVQL